MTIGRFKDSNKKDFATYDTVAELVAAPASRFSDGAEILLRGIDVLGDSGEAISTVVESAAAGVKSITLTDGRFANIYKKRTVVLNSYADFLAFPQGAAAFTTISLAGYASEGDGGEGIWDYIDDANYFPNSTIARGAVVRGTGWTGTTDRWERRIGDRLNVKWWGAKSDGVTDARSAIQDAMIYAQSYAAKSRKLFFPKGEYAIASNISINGKTCGLCYRWPQTFIGQGQYSGGFLTAPTSDLLGPADFDVEDGTNEVGGYELIGESFSVRDDSGSGFIPAWSGTTIVYTGATEIDALVYAAAGSRGMTGMRDIAWLGNGTAAGSFSNTRRIAGNAPAWTPQSDVWKCKYVLLHDTGQRGSSNAVAVFTDCIFENLQFKYALEDTANFGGGFFNTLRNVRAVGALRDGIVIAMVTSTSLVECSVILYGRNAYRLIGAKNNCRVESCTVDVCLRPDNPNYQAWNTGASTLTKQDVANRPFYINKRLTWEDYETDKDRYGYPFYLETDATYYPFGDGRQLEDALAFYNCAAEYTKGFLYMADGTFGKAKLVNCQQSVFPGEISSFRTLANLTATLTVPATTSAVTFNVDTDTTSTLAVDDLIFVGYAGALTESGWDSAYDSSSYFDLNIDNSKKNVRGVFLKVTARTSTTIEAARIWDSANEAGYDSARWPSGVREWQVGDHVAKVYTDAVPFVRAETTVSAIQRNKVHFIGSDFKNINFLISAGRWNSPLIDLLINGTTGGGRSTEMYAVSGEFNRRDYDNPTNADITNDSVSVVPSSFFGVADELYRTVTTGSSTELVVASLDKTRKLGPVSSGVKLVTGATLSSTPATALGTGDFTWTVTILPTANSGSVKYFGLNSGSGTFTDISRLAFSIVSGNLSSRHFDGSTAAVTETIATSVLDNPLVLTVVRASGVITYYINGESVGNSIYAGAATIDFATNTYFRVDDDTNAAFSKWYAFSVAASAAQVQALYEYGAAYIPFIGSCIGAWLLNEGTGRHVEDISGNEVYGLLGASGVTHTVPSKKGRIIRKAQSFTTDGVFVENSDILPENAVIIGFIADGKYQPADPSVDQNLSLRRIYVASAVANTITISRNNSAAAGTTLASITVTSDADVDLTVIYEIVE